MCSGETADAAGIAGLLKPGAPSAVLIDGVTPYPEIARKIRDRAPEAGLLFVVPSYDLAEVVLLLQSGAGGCISLDDPLEDVVRATTAVGRGEIVLPPAIAARALAALARGESPPSSGPESGLVEPLSEREGDVLRLLAQGMTNKDIAQTLLVSVRTVEAHLRNVYGKLGVRSRTEAVLWAVRRGYGPEAA